VADDEGVGIVVDHGVLVLQQLAGGGERDGDAGEPGRGGCGRDRAAGGGAGDAPAVVKVFAQGGRGVGGRECCLKFDEVVDAVPAAAAVAFRRPGIGGGAHVPVLDGQGDQPVGPACDVPRQAPAEAHGADIAVRVGGDRLAGQSEAGCLAVRPGGEVPDPVADRVRLQGAGAGAGAGQVVGVVVEEQVPVRDHALQDADGVDDRGYGDPGDGALGAGGAVVAVFVGGGLELQAADEVPSCPPVRAGNGVGAAAGAQAQDYWCSAAIPSVRYSPRGGGLAYWRPASAGGVSM